MTFTINTSHLSRYQFLIKSHRYDCSKSSSLVLLCLSIANRYELDLSICLSVCLSLTPTAHTLISSSAAAAEAAWNILFDDSGVAHLTIFYFVSQMANRTQIPTNNSALIAMIADEDTITGFLLAGVGNVDIRRKTNYLIVDSKTTVKQIEDAFKEFTTREDIAIVLISQYVANMIRYVVDSYNNPVPAILEIPSKDHPYDPAHDSVLSRVKYLFNTESVAGDRR
ncbi:hypothetical protein L2E82_47645 [Cichorium intybus]|uniref:Uncharacterized protein n=1 Tax=Cichorium intybus TaxID=13427 RepID=A0ACB8Z083_CICIN|nr:hypothetical protein L2E82_47645 [Cichorium intybus]